MAVLKALSRAPCIYVAQLWIQPKSNKSRALFPGLLQYIAYLGINITGDF